MPPSAHHWTRVARSVSRRLEGLDRQARVGRVREEAAKLGLEAHTVRRYLAVIEFLDRVGVNEEDTRRLPLGPLEVILRIWSRDPSVAARALKLVRAGQLTFRRALAIEKGLKSKPAEGASPTVASWEQTEWDRQRVARTLGRAPGDLVETNQLDDPRFDLVQAQRTYASGATTVALLDEASRAELVDGGRVAGLARDALIAATLFDEVVVAFAFERSVAEFERYVRLAAPEVERGIRVIARDAPIEAEDGAEPQVIGRAATDGG